MLRPQAMAFRSLRGYAQYLVGELQMQFQTIGSDLDVPQGGTAPRGEKDRIL